jgi:hypothetical protein
LYFYGHSAYFTAKWYTCILWSFGILFPVLVHCTEKNLATIKLQIFTTLPKSKYIRTNQCKGRNPILSLFVLSQFHSSLMALFPTSFLFAEINCWDGIPHASKQGPNTLFSWRKLPCDCQARGHWMCKELPTISVNRVVDKKIIIGINGRPMRRKGSRGRWPKKCQIDKISSQMGYIHIVVNLLSMIFFSCCQWYFTPKTIW